MCEDIPAKRKGRILLKLSGEVLAGESGTGIDTLFTDRLAGVLASSVSAGWQIGMVTGGGNFVRGAELTGIKRTRADYMGMLATVINGLAMQDALEKHGVRVAVLSALDVPGTGVEFYTPGRAEELFDSGYIVIFAGGTGNPLLTTDTAAALRAAQTGCSILFKGTKVDGVYDRDPVQFSDAERFERLSYDQVLEQNLRVMDAAAVVVCRESNLPIVVFDVTDLDVLKRIFNEPAIGTVVGEV